MLKLQRATTTDVIQELKDRFNIFILQNSTHSRIFFLYLLEIGFFAYRNPILFSTGLVIVVLSILLTIVISSFLKKVSFSKSKCASLFSITAILVSLAKPSYAFLEGFETVLQTIITSTGGAVEAQTATLFVNILKVGFFVVIAVTAILAFFNREDQEKMKNIAISGLGIISVYVLIEVAGNFIFGAGGDGAT